MLFIKASDFLCTGEWDIQLMYHSEGGHAYLVSSLQMKPRKDCSDTDSFPHYEWRSNLRPQLSTIGKYTNHWGSYHALQFFYTLCHFVLRQLRPQVSRESTWSHLTDRQTLPYLTKTGLTGICKTSGFTNNYMQNYNNPTNEGQHIYLASITLERALNPVCLVWGSTSKTWIKLVKIKKLYLTSLISNKQHKLCRG